MIPQPIVSRRVAWAINADTTVEERASIPCFRHHGYASASQIVSIPASSITRADWSISSSGSIVSCMTPMRKAGTRESSQSSRRRGTTAEGPQPFIRLATGPHRSRREIGLDRGAGRQRVLEELFVRLVHLREVVEAAQVDAHADGAGERAAGGACDGVEVGEACRVCSATEARTTLPSRSRGPCPARKRKSPALMPWE